MIDFVGKILDQNPELYASIQKNSKAMRVRQTYIAECMRLCEMVDAGDQDGFMRAMLKAAEHYGKTHEALMRSDNLINRSINEKEVKGPR
jgi:prephenate dehydrogenase